jgi:EmrB/QacA subfamily drug resistance transporter
MTDRAEQAVVAGAAGRRAPEPSSRRWWSLVVVALIQVMVVLDTTIVTIALPSAQHALGLSVTGRQWVVTAYTLAFGASLLFGGRVGDIIGRRDALIIGAIGFAVASAAGGAAVDSGMLIGARAVQGLFAGLLAPTTLALLTVTFTDGRERATAFSIFSTAAMSGAAIGLILGGVLTQFAGWRWCLYVNAPIAALAVTGAVSVLPNPRSGRPQRLDIGGALLGSAGIAAVVLAFGEAGSLGWGSGVVIGSLAAAMVLLAAFVLVESRAADPLLPLPVVTSRPRAAAFLSIAAISFGALGMFLFVTFLMQDVLGYSALRAGLAFIPYVVVNGLAATQLTRRLLPHTRPVLLIIPGLLLMAAALLLLSRLSPHSSYALSLLPVVTLAGLAVGLIVAPALSTATQGPHPGVASAFVSTSQQVGGSFGTALLNTIAASSAAAYLAARRAGQDGALVPAAVVRAATVHGDTVASRCGAAVLAAAAVGVAVLLTRPGRPRA